MSDSTKYLIVVICFGLGSFGVVYSFLNAYDMPWLIFIISLALVVIFGPAYYYFKSKNKN